MIESVIGHSTRTGMPATVAPVDPAGREGEQEAPNASADARTTPAAPRFRDTEGRSLAWYMAASSLTCRSLCQGSSSFKPLHPLHRRLQKVISAGPQDRHGPRPPFGRASVSRSFREVGA